MNLLSVQGIVAGYGAAEHILKGVSIAVNAGEIVTIIGPNGAGKSTLLKVIAALVPAQQGTLHFNGQELTAQDALARSRAGISFVPQEKNVFGTLSVAENLLISAFSSPRQAQQRAEQAFERYPMLASKRRAAARTLSGGQRQILAMAMGLMTEPKLIVLDEPTAGLAPQAAEALFDAILALQASGLPVLMVEQHAVEALAISTRGYVLVAGQNAAEQAGPVLAADAQTRRLFLGG